MASVQFVLAAGFALFFFVVLANLVVVQYGRGAVRSALDRAARAASIDGDASKCEAVAGQGLSQTLGGVMGDGVQVVCSADPATVTATASVWFQSWTPLTPDFVFTLQATATRERPP